MSNWIDYDKWHVYKISNALNDKLYIGISANPDKRWRQHLYYASKPQYNQPLYVDMRKYGVDKFRMEIIEEGTRYAMFKQEQHWIQALSTKRPHGYNSTYGYEISTNVHNLPRHDGIYNVYTYTNSLTGEIFSIKVGVSEEWTRYLRDARSGRPGATQIVNAIRSIWEQGGKVVIRKVYKNLDIGEASRLQGDWLRQHGRKMRNGGSVLDRCVLPLALG